jgi:hypothetical protein
MTLIGPAGQVGSVVTLQSQLQTLDVLGPS